LKPYKPLNTPPTLLILIMPEEPFLLVSLEESESRELAKVISNKTSRKILGLLSKKNATETQIAKELKLPLSTVHYNLHHLVKANLVKAEEFHYSEKGKEVNHYSLANKLIIIAPKKTSIESFRDKLKSILPISIIVLVVAGIIQLLNMFRAGTSKLMAAAPETAMKRTEEAVITRGAGLIATGGGNVTPQPARPLVETVIQTAPQNTTLWFLIGAAFTILLLIIWYWFVTRKKKLK